MTNPLETEEGRNDLQLKDYAFYPIIEIHNYSPFDRYKHLDIWIGPAED